MNHIEITQNSVLDDQIKWRIMKCPDRLQTLVLGDSKAMNDNDHTLIFDQIFSILNYNISSWSVIEVEQFLQLVNCGQFEKIIRFFGVNGQMLLQPNKIEALITPQLKPSTTLLFQKLMFMLEELKPTQYRQSSIKHQRHSRDTISINGNLMKTIHNAIDSVKEKNMVMWTTEDLLSFLSAGGMGRFKEIIQKTSCDGMIMLYVIPDRRKMLRMSKFFEGRQLQEIVYVSQIMLSQYYMVRIEECCEDIEEIELSPNQHSEIIFNLKRVQSYESLNEYPEDYMIAQSMESAYEQNDFIMTEDVDNASILETNEVSDRDEEEKGKWDPMEKEKSAMRQGGRFEPVFDEKEEPVRESYQSLAVSQYPEERLTLTESQYPEDQSVRDSQPSEAKIEHYQLAQSIIGGCKDNTTSQLDQSHYPQLDESEYNTPLAQSEYNELAQSDYPNQLDSSQYPQEGQTNQNLLQQSNYVQKPRLQPKNSKQTVDTIPDPDKVVNEAILKYKAQLEKIKSVTLTMPFNLMTFKYLNEIVLGEVKKSNKNNESTDQNDAIGDKQTFGVQGCKFGREGLNDYSYPDQSSISHRHAMIFFKDRNFYLQDLASKTGTFIQIDEIQIYDGLIIQLAFEVEITFQIIMRQPQQGAIKMIFKLPANMPNYQAIIPNKMNCRIGRGKNSKILIDSNNVSVSQKHAEIAYEDQKFWFKDLGSQNGSWQRLSDKGVMSQLYPLSVGDNIRISSKKRLKVLSIEINDY